MSEATASAMSNTSLPRNVLARRFAHRPAPRHPSSQSRFIPYPFQNNISCLDVEDQVKCLTGLVEAKTLTSTSTSKPSNFADWIDRVMGPGINEVR